MAKVIERSKKPVKDPKEVEYYVHYADRAFPFRISPFFLHSLLPCATAPPPVLLVPHGVVCKHEQRAH